MDVFRFRFSECSLKVTSPPPDCIPSVIPDWHLLRGCSIPHGIAERVPPSSISSVPRLGLICHAYNINSDLLSHLQAILDGHDIAAIVFTTDHHEKREQLEKFLRSVKVLPTFCRILILPNLGRDVVPFWKSLAEIAPFADIFLKLHWKKSPHLDFHFPQPGNKPACDAWNQDLYSSLVPTKRKDMQALLQLFNQHKLSCIFPRPWAPFANLHWHSSSNLKHAAALLEDLDCPPSAILVPLIFPAGNMFYGSIQFFSLFLNHFLEKDDYPREPLAADGTVLHAIERIYALLSASKGYNIATLVPNESVPLSDGEYGADNLERRIVVFPVPELLFSDSNVHSSGLGFEERVDAHTPNSLPYLYQSLIIRETQRLIKANSELRNRMRWLRPGHYPAKIKTWLTKKLNR